MKFKYSIKSIDRSINKTVATPNRAVASPPMVEPILIGGSVMVASHLVSNMDKTFVEKIDFLHSYYSFPEEYTRIIDTMLADPKHGVMGSRITVGVDSYLPDEGYHYFYKDRTSWYGYFFDFLKFEKVVSKKSGKVAVNYRCYPWFWNPDSFNVAMNRIFTVDGGTIRTHSVDTSAHDIAVIPISKRYHQVPKKIQTDIAQFIIDQYGKNDNNAKMLITGPPGVGKSYIGKIVKRLLDADNKTCQLFDDFNPTAVGVSVNRHIISQASVTQPVIIVIDEIDAVMKKALSVKDTIGETRLCHAENKATLNSMFDCIGDSRFVIAIYTSNMPVDDMKTAYDASFLRKGRCDHYIDMQNDSFTVVDA